MLAKSFTLVDSDISSMEILLKTCHVCKELKPLDAFSKMKSSKDGHQRRCKDCFNAWHRNLPAKSKQRRKNYYEANKERLLDIAKWRRLLQTYGITKEQYTELLLGQDYKCAICPRSHFDERNGLVVDHDHTTGTIRALLCDRCNVGLGSFGDDIQRLLNAANYLKEKKR